MANGTISQISFEDAPDMIALLLCATLFKLGGQITLTLGEIREDTQRVSKCTICTWS